MKAILHGFMVSLRDKMQETLSLLSETTPVQRIESSRYFLEAIAFAACKAKKNMVRCIMLTKRGRF